MANRIISILLVLFTLASCQIQHNIPLNQTPNEKISTGLYKIFVDQNGNFYPDNWIRDYGKPSKNARRFAYSLNTIAQNKDLIDSLSNFEINTLNDIKKETAQTNRVFILIHGFNNGETDAEKAYLKIRNQIGYNLKTDYFIDYYWDGMVASGAPSSLKIWFNAAGYSQLAGEFGLRKILNSLDHKEIVIIAHSRGASVVFSALSNPPYSEKFKIATKKEHGINIGSNSPLSENNNKIRCILLAPAIGEIDFKTPNYYNKDNTYRKFSDQLKQVYISINRDDPVLKKYIGFISDNFNPTNLGYDPSVFRNVESHYKIFKKKDFSGMKKHGYLDYLDNPLFEEILQEMKIKTK